MALLDKIEVADIIRLYGQLYLKKYGSSTTAIQWKVMQDIVQCRTVFLGGHIDECSECGAERNSYNSCRNRHCPKCQALPALKWILKRSEEILPIHYFHVVFTLPEELNSLIYRNQKLAYDILFKAASETLLQLCSQKEHLGATVGITGILHTWGQNLLFHPHVHFLVTGGGLSADGENWILARDKFLIPYRILSEVFKGKFLDLLRKSGLSVEPELLADLRWKDWDVFSQPIKKSENVIHYFGNYTHRVGISNNRIIKLENDHVFFKWKDRKDKSKTKIMRLHAVEFMRRFLLHVLPKKFVKIRYYGLYMNRDRKKTIAYCQSLLGAKEKIDVKFIKKTWQQWLLELRGVDIGLCPFCGKGRMVWKTTLLPTHISLPPPWRMAS